MRFIMCAVVAASVTLGASAALRAQQDLQV